jgi:hypothetical protein
MRRRTRSSGTDDALDHVLLRCIVAIPREMFCECTGLVRKGEGWKGSMEIPETAPPEQRERMSGLSASEEYGEYVLVEPLCEHSI